MADFRQSDTVNTSGTPLGNEGVACELRWSEPLTVARLRRLIAESVQSPRLRGEDQVLLYARRLREIGLVPAGKPGRGDDGSAKLTPQQAARILVACATPLDPRDAAEHMNLRAVDEVARILSGEMPSRTVLAYSTEGGIAEGVVLSAALLRAVRAAISGSATLRTLPAPSLATPPTPEA